jgi:hypothetical protein
LNPSVEEDDADVEEATYVDVEENDVDVEEYL